MKDAKKELYMDKNFHKINTSKLFVSETANLWYKISDILNNKKISNTFLLTIFLITEIEFQSEEELNFEEVKIIKNFLKEMEFEKKIQDGKMESFLIKNIYPLIEKYDIKKFKKR